MAESEEAKNGLIKQREQLAAKLQFERRNTLIGWQRAMSVKDPTLLANEEKFELREMLVEKEKEIGWQRDVPVEDPTLLLNEEIFKLREALIEKEKEIARLSKENKELKLCWKDSAKLLKAVWKQHGDETKKIEDAVKKRQH